MIYEHSFFMEIIAPKGLSSIEPYLKDCLLPIKTYFSQFTRQVILCLDSHLANDKVDFNMDGSLEPLLIGSGDIKSEFDEALAMTSSLSIALSKAGFAHRIIIDDEANARSMTFGFEVEKIIHLSNYNQ